MASKDLSKFDRFVNEIFVSVLLWGEHSYLFFNVISDLVTLERFFQTRTNEKVPSFSYMSDQ